MAGESSRISTGVAGLDEILSGGLLPRRTYAVRGGPGTGKTILGLHFLVAGAAQGEYALCITFSEPERQLRKNAESLGLDLHGLTFLDLTPTSDVFARMQTYDIFTPAEVERQPITQKILDKVSSLKPARIFLDAMTQFRYLATDEFQVRKQALSLLRYLTEQGATVLFASEGTAMLPDDDLQFLSDGIVNLEFSLKFGRSVHVTKFRGSDFRGGCHAIRISAKGLEVFPRLVPGEAQTPFVVETIASGVPELDEVLHGGLERGTITIISGPSGVGKTTLGLQFMKEAARRGEHSVAYSFEEEVEIMLTRCEAINIPARAMRAKGMLDIVKVEPLTYSPDEFARMVRRQVETQKISIVMIDSTAGYRLALRGQDMVAHLHALCKYLQNRGVTVLLIVELESLVTFELTEAGIGYLADNLLFLRYLEYKTRERVELRKTIGVLKKRASDFEKDLRLLEITPAGIKVGKSIPGLTSILVQLPTWSPPEEGRR
ncbi:MAG: Circadian clock protein kinase KaiC [bacterium ADurb.Bin429]|nr:MAG: Circadian clock protein kinase KaiC [bacterium ADurb.Bin429]